MSALLLALCLSQAPVEVPQVSGAVAPVPVVTSSPAPAEIVVSQPDAPDYVVVATPPAAPAPGPRTLTVTPAHVPQIQPGQEIGWATETARRAWVAAKDGNWGLFVSILLMACLSLFSFLFVRSKDLRERLRAYMPEVALAVSMLGYVAVALQSLPPGAELRDWWDVIGPALKTGAAAVGAYEVIVKRLLQVWLPRIMALVKRAKAKATSP